MKIFNKLAIILILPLALVGCAPSDTVESLSLQNTINLPNVHERIDHMDFDSKTNRLFVGALENDSLEIIDAKQGKIIKSIKNLGGPQGVVYVEQYSTIYVSCRNNGDLVAIDSNTYLPRNKISFSDEADNLHYLKSSDELLLGYGNGGLAIVDPSDLSVKGKVELDGHPEGIVGEEDGNLVYVNVPGSDTVYTIDRKTYKIVEKNKSNGVSSNFPIALNEKEDVLAYYTRVPNQVVFMNPKTGTLLRTYSGTSDVDDMFFEPKTGFLYLIGGNGRVEVVSLDKDKEVRLVSKTITGSGARTGLLSTDSSQLFVAVPEKNGESAKILIFRLK